jgi:hypothetical protein
MPRRKVASGVWSFRPWSAVDSCSCASHAGMRPSPLGPFVGNPESEGAGPPRSLLRHANQNSWCPRRCCWRTPIIIWFGPSRRAQGRRTMLTRKVFNHRRKHQRGLVQRASLREFREPSGTSIRSASRRQTFVEKLRRRHVPRLSTEYLINLADDPG